MEQIVGPLIGDGLAGLLLRTLGALLADGGRSVEQ